MLCCYLYCCHGTVGTVQWLEQTIGRKMEMTADVTYAIVFRYMTLLPRQTIFWNFGNHSLNVIICSCFFLGRIVRCNCLAPWYLGTLTIANISLIWRLDDTATALMKYKFVMKYRKWHRENGRSVRGSAGQCNGCWSSWCACWC